MTESELMEELEAIYRQQGPEDALTTDELSHVLGVGHAAVRRRLRAVKKAGRLQAVRVQRENLAGQPHTVTAYRILTAT